MGMCAKLKWNRRRLGMSQKDFAKAVGVCQNTIYRLENDETAWQSIRDETQDKIQLMFDYMVSWQPSDKEVKATMDFINPDRKTYLSDDDYDEELPKVPILESVVVNSDILTENDKENLIKLKFMMETLSNIKTHTELDFSMKMLKKIVNQY